MTELDLAAIMAEHRPDQQGKPYCVGCMDLEAIEYGMVVVPWPCLPSAAWTTNRGDTVMLNLPTSARPDSRCEDCLHPAAEHGLDGCEHAEAYACTCDGFQWFGVRHVEGVYTEARTGADGHSHVWADVTELRETQPRKLCVRCGEERVMAQDFVWDEMEET